MQREELFQEARILIIDDESPMVEAMRHALVARGYPGVRGVTDEMVALEVFEEFQPDLILLDLVMPGMGGMRLLEEIRKIAPPDIYLPILIITGHPSTEARLGALEKGASDFITKPFDPLDLTLRVTAFLETRFLHRQLARKHAEMEVRAAEVAAANQRLRREIMEREQAEKALRKSEEKLSLAIAGADLGTWDWDLVSGALVWSARKKQMFGFPVDQEMSIEVFLNAIDPEHRERVEAALGRAREAGMQYDVEYPIHWPDGAMHWIAARGRVVLDAGGKPVSMSGTAQDITERKRIEAIAIQARQEAEQANRAKSEFLSRMSHELRTPLNAILGFGQLLETEGRDPDEIDNIEQILKAGRHLLGLINEVLDISRIEAGALALSIESVPLMEALEEAVSLVRPAANRRQITLGDFACDRHILADQQRLKQIFLNLLSNAIKYNRVGGSVSIRVEEPGCDTLRLLIRDTGQGIAPDDAAKVFAPFERLGADQAKTEGIGLGLTISKRLVELMGGKIGFESVPGEGSTFWVELPLADNPVTRIEAAAPEEAEKVTLRPCTLLYIEDNLSNLKLIERLLARLPGVKLLAAMQGQLGLELAREHQPDLIMLDLHLPDINGDIVLQRLLGNPETAHIPVMMISADATPGQVDRLRAIGACEYLTKPLDVKLFLATLQTALAGARN